jgi:hypothetical protein
MSSNTCRRRLEDSITEIFGIELSATIGKEEDALLTGDAKASAKPVWFTFLSRLLYELPAIDSSFFYDYKAAFFAAFAFKGCLSCKNWHLGPYGQYSSLWYLLHYLVL